MTIEVLHLAGCPNHAALVPHLRELLRRAGIDADVRLRRIVSEDEARRRRFLGSPTLRIDGRDVEPDAAARTDFGLNCRLYRTPDGLAGAPPDAMILSAIGRGRSIGRLPGDDAR